jgi:hypothetical protein
VRYVSQVLPCHLDRKGPDEFVTHLKYEDGQWYSRTRWYNDGYVHNHRWERVPRPSQYALTELLQRVT